MAALIHYNQDYIEATQWQKNGLVSPNKEQKISFWESWPALHEAANVKFQLNKVQSKYPTRLLLWCIALYRMQHKKYANSFVYK